MKVYESSRQVHKMINWKASVVILLLTNRLRGYKGATRKNYAVAAVRMIWSKYNRIQEHELIF